MKIERNAPLPSGVPVETKKPLPAQTKKEPAAQPDAYNVTLSKAVAQAPEAALDDEQVRWEKVAAIRKQLEAGTYNISGKDVASKILDALKS